MVDESPMGLQLVDVSPMGLRKCLFYWAVSFGGTPKKAAHDGALLSLGSDQKHFSCPSSYPLCGQQRVCKMSALTSNQPWPWDWLCGYKGYGGYHPSHAQDIETGYAAQRPEGCHPTPAEVLERRARGGARRKKGKVG